MRRAVVAVLLLLAACGGGDGRVIVAAGTTLVDSGLIDEVVTTYERGHPGVGISVVGDATARVLELGRRGAAGVLITHDPAREVAFVGEGKAARYEPLMTSRFVLVGPAEPAALLAGLTPEQAFARIAAEGWPFVARADGSGTAAAEAAIWKAAGIDPDLEPWYSATGLGMGETLQVADQREAFTLAEEGTFLGAAGVLSLVGADLIPDDLLRNPYHVILVAGSPAAAGDFVDWLLSAAGSAAIVAANQDLFGTQVFVVEDSSG